MNQDDLERVFARIPLLQKYTPGDFSITRLSGFTNRNYRLHKRDQDWVLRIPRPATNRYIDRPAEVFNQSRAQQLGLAPRVAWRDSSGVSLTPTLTSSRALNPDDFAGAAQLQGILEPIGLLHRSGIEFQGRVNPGALLERQFALLGESDQALYRQRMSRAERILKRLESRDVDYVASHNDLVLENLLLERQRLWVIDWEYSAMASPYWDLATLCNAARLNLRQSQQLLAVYCAHGAPMEESLLFDYRELLQLLSDCWMATLAAD